MTKITPITKTVLVIRDWGKVSVYDKKRKKEFPAPSVDEAFGQMQHMELEDHEVDMLV